MTEERDEPGSMPRPAMAGAERSQASGGMPIPGMPAQEQAPPPSTPSELPRFPPPSGGPLESRYEPGFIEVQFRTALAPRVVPGGPGRPPSLAAAIPLDAVNQLLRRYQAIGAVASGGDLVTLRFAADANVLDIAAQLNQLSEVEYAAPVPSALPPASPP